MEEDRLELRRAARELKQAPKRKMKVACTIM